MNKNFQKPSTLVELLRLRAQNQGDKQAYTFLKNGETEEGSLTYSQLDRKARSIAAKLQEISTVSERALLLYPPGLDFIAAFFGCLYAGVVAVPTYPPRRNRPDPRIQAIVTDAQATVVLTTTNILSDITPRLAYAPELTKLHWLATDNLPNEIADHWQSPKIQTDTLAFLQYTSGSTGTPKGVMISHGNMQYNQEMLKQGFGHSEKTIGVGWLPLFHDMGLIGHVLQPLYLGIPSILMSPVAFLQKPVRWLQAISRYKATTSGGPNFAYNLCIQKITAEQKSQLDLSCWHVAFNGSEPIRAETLDQFATTFKTCGFRQQAFYPCYGMAETTLFVAGGLKTAFPIVHQIEKNALEQNQVVITKDNNNIQKMVGCGQTWLEQKIVIADPETFTPCLEQQNGEIWISGSNVAQGYWNKPEATKQTFQAHLADTGEGPFLRTGDLGFLKDGELFVTGRLKDLIIIKGRNYYPQDIELTVEKSHSALVSGSGAAFSVDMKGEERLVIAQEVQRTALKKLNVNEVVNTIRETVFEQHEIGVDIILLLKTGSIPKTSSGKIQRHAGREQFLTNQLTIVGEWRQTTLIDSEHTPSPSQERNKTKESPLLRGEGVCLLEKTAIPSDHVSPRTPLEEKLAQLWAEVLGVEKVGIYDNFFELGGYSLLATQLISRIADTFSKEISLRDLFKSPTIADLAVHIETTEKGKTQQPILPIPRHEALPLSFAQQRLWFLAQWEADRNTSYNEFWGINIKGPLKVVVLEQSLTELIQRHEILRTTFSTKDGIPFQVIAPKIPRVTLPIIDLHSSSENIQQNEVQRTIIEENQRSFDLINGPLLRLTLVRLSDIETKSGTLVPNYVFLLSIHHIIIDGWSMGIFIRELTTLYQAFSQNQPSPLPSLPIQYVDFAHWQRQRLQGEVMEQQINYWQQQLAGIPALTLLPTDHARPPIQSFQGNHQAFEITKELAQKLKEISQQSGATLFMTLLTAFVTLLYRYTGQEDIVVGSPIANRHHRDIESLIGFFVNTLVLRACVAGNPHFLDLLEQVKQTSLDAYAHQDVPFEHLVEVLQPARDLSYSPLFQVMFVLQNAPMASLELPELEIELLETEYVTAKFDLTLLMEETTSGLKGQIEYNTDLFEAATITRMIGHFKTLLEGMVVNPKQSISELPLLTKNEQHQLLVEWNNTSVDYSKDKCLHQLFEAQVEKTPDAIAVVFPSTSSGQDESQPFDSAQSRQLTYQELNHRANQLAHYLQTLGVKPDVLVGICVERSVEMVVGLLGILKAGGAYLPLDTDYPVARLAFILEDAQISVLITLKKLVAELPEQLQQLTSKQPNHMVCLDTDREILSQFSATNPVTHVKPEHLAYVIYTSGSTGQPKGVLIPHANVTRLFAATQAWFHFNEQDVWTLFHSYAFDFSVWELWGALLYGGRLIVVPYWISRAPESFYELLVTHQVTVLNQTPSAFRQLIQAEEQLGTHPNLRLRLVIFGGEALEFQTLKPWFERHGDQVPQLVNMYGITETTVHVTYRPLTNADLNDSGSMIGSPLPDLQAYLLDHHLQVVPIGVPGELYIGGAGLARGYLNRPELTAERFIPHPFSDENTARLYKTGDLARYLPDGNIEYLGRIDNQVQIRGFRVELGEIEKALTQHPAVRESVVIVKEEPEQHQRLIAYLVQVISEDKMDISELRRFIAETLPDYMVPSLFVKIEAIPLTPNGKIDHRALPEPEAVRPELETAYVMPQTDIEQQIAQVWQEVLQLEEVGIYDNFFDLGGHSLLMAQVHNQLQTRLESSLSMVEMFQYPTIHALAQHLGKEKSQQAETSFVASSPQRRIEGEQNRDIAVIGLSGRFPGAKNIETFWQNLVDGVESINRFSDEELLSSGVNQALLEKPNYVKAGGILEEVELFDAAFFGYAPKEAEIMDPQQRVFLECAWEAIENAGYGNDLLTEAVGVYAGISSSTYYSNNLVCHPELVESVGQFPLLINNDKDFLPTHVSYKLNLKGPSVNVQTACSTSLVAVHLACQSILNDECKMALAGGVSIRVPQKVGYLYQEDMILSPDGHCRAFDAKAQGIVGGQGVGIVVLKKLEQALADGDYIYAVIKNSAINNDGALKVGYTAPSVDGQAAVITEAMRGINGETIS